MNALVIWKSISGLPGDNTIIYTRVMLQIYF